MTALHVLLVRSNVYAKETEERKKIEKVKICLNGEGCAMQAGRQIKKAVPGSVKSKLKKKRKEDSYVRIKNTHLMNKPRGI